MNDSLSGTLQKMGSNFIVAAFVPAMAFIIISTIAFQPILPEEFTSRLGTDFLQSTFIALLFTTILGFTLYTLSNYIYKAFEGYTFILAINTPLRRSGLRRQKRRIQKLETQLEQVKRELRRIEKNLEREAEKTSITEWRKKRRKRYAMRKRKLEDHQYELIAFRNENFPPDSHLVLPTRFGNILKASELYPGSRYGIDGVAVWGRLAHVIPPGGGSEELGGMALIDEANNQCLFLLNTALLATIFSLLSFLASFYQGLLLWAKVNSVQLLSFMRTDQESYIYKEGVGIYLVVALMAVGTAWFFYQASLLNVGEFGSMIRAAYDLYRSRLLKQLNLALPTTLEKERDTWKAVSEFMVGGDEFGAVSLPYFYHETPTTQDEPEYVSIEDVENN